MARVELSRGRGADALASLVPILQMHAKTKPLPVPADRFADALADALAERGDPKNAIELLKALHNDSARLDSELDWLLPHLRSLIGGYQLRLGERDKAMKNLRIAVELMEQSRLKAPALVVARAERDSTQPRAPPRVKSPHRLAELDGARSMSDLSHQPTDFGPGPSCRCHAIKDS